MVLLVDAKSYGLQCHLLRREFGCSDGHGSSLYGQKMGWFDEWAGFTWTIATSTNPIMYRSSVIAVESRKRRYIRRTDRWGPLAFAGLWLCWVRRIIQKAGKLSSPPIHIQFGALLPEIVYFDSSFIENYKHTHHKNTSRYRKLSILKRQNHVLSHLKTSYSFLFKMTYSSPSLSSSSIPSAALMLNVGAWSTPT